MKPFSLLFISVFFYLSAYSQTWSETVYVLMPAREFDQTKLIGKLGIKKEIIYAYKKKEKNKDSFVVRINFFDSLGNCTERDDFIKESTSPVQITNYTYTSNMLIKAQMQSAAGHSYATISTYKYDSAGNHISQKDYVGKGESDFKFQNEKMWEYDSAKNITAELYKSTLTGLYKSDSYQYKDNKLHEAVTFLPDGTVFFTNIYEYDTVLNKTTVWVDNKEGRTLKFEKFYNKDGQLIKHIEYVPAYFYKNFASDEIQYLPNGLAYKEIFTPADGRSLYFTRYYYREY